MNQNNPSPNLNRSWEESQQIIKDLEAEIAQLKAQQEVKECRCHIIDPAKMRILLWINRHKNGKPDTCVLKIAEQRLLGLPRSDRRGETYWRFDELLEKKDENEVSGQSQEAPPTSFKCEECKTEVVVIGSDNPAAEIKQRERLKQELAQMENKETKESKSKREELKEQIAQAIEENKQAELKVKESHGTETNNQ